ncbi:hypothetical protein IV203_018814 [Nitzschia inconspicua]|uniref:Uncharacterized protein n=1 Tax=Nitzschia inconspicua TaxID=303405 RepID=A0A9K3Q6Q3_9STRA|nr:hypothetical protein IV203_018814 [Nitzschia inconspicua]
MRNEGTRLFVSMAAARALQSVCHQNNRGGSLYKQGRCIEALRSLKETVKTSKTFLKECLEQVEGTTAFDLCISLQVLPSRTVQAQEDHSFLDPSVYSKPFEIEMTLLGNGKASLGEQVIQGEPCVLFSTLSPILIFNFALAYHTLALTSRDDDDTGRRSFLSRARDLYCLAYTTLQGERQLREELLDPALLHFLVQAILNNLSQCYASLDDTENSTKCCKLLLKSILLFQHRRHHPRSSTREAESHDDRNSWNDESTALFWKNTLFLILKDPGFAPAA